MASIICASTSRMKESKSLKDAVWKSTTFNFGIHSPMWSALVNFQLSPQLFFLSNFHIHKIKAHQKRISIMALNELPEMPNGPVLELHGQRKRLHVPFGLKPLLEELTREVLRYQPEDIYQFLYQYSDAKLAKRDGTKRKSGGSGRWSISEGPDLLTEEEMLQMLDELGISRDMADHYATTIQSAYRGFQTRKGVGQKLHKDHRKSWEWKRWSWEGPSKLSPEELQMFLDELRVDLNSANVHATKIQAAYRGFKVRKSFARIYRGGGGPGGADEEEYEDDDEEEDDEGEEGDLVDEEEEEEGYPMRKSLAPNDQATERVSELGMEEAKKSSLGQTRQSEGGGLLPPPEEGEVGEKRGTGGSVQSTDLPEEGDGGEGEADQRPSGTEEGLLEEEGAN